MNQLIISIFDMCMEHESHEKIIALNSTLSPEKMRLEILQALDVSLEKHRILNKALTQASNDFSENVSDDDETITPYHEALEKALNEKEDFQNHHNFLLSDDVKISLSLFLYNEDSLMDFEVLILQDWFEKKKSS